MTVMERRFLLVFVLKLLTKSSFGQPSPGTCEPPDFECNDGTCLPSFFVCNEFPNCDDAEDELSCPSTCEPSDFVCDDGTCLPRFFVCDGYPLCIEGEDEDYCPITCKRSEYYCYSDRLCIPRIYYCDGFQDCSDGEDERYCPTPCGPSEVMCDLYYCLPSFTMCNGFRDCPNGNDELDCPHACASTTPLNVSGSVFSSPNFPAPNTDLTPCSISARAPRGEAVVVTFTAFDSYDSDLGCLFELSIHDPFYGTIMEANCGSSIPPTVVSSSNTVGINYSTYGKEFRQGKGFEASVKFVNQSDLEELQCEYSVFFDEGYLTSPGFPELYPNNFECFYSIVAPPGQIVRLSFTSFNVEDHSSCDFDNLSIFDVISYSSRLLVKLCGSLIPADLRSSETALSVVFTTDSFVRSTGFNASISFETPECRMDILVISEHYFHNNDVDCTYLFQAPPGHTLRITDLDFEPFNCEDETFLAYDGNSTTASLLIDFCNFPTQPVSTTGNEMFLVVISPFHFPGYGLYFEIEAVIAATHTACNSTVFVSPGAFTTPNFPNFYSNNESCHFLAEAPSGKMIGLVFNSFRVQFTPGCVADSVKVYDGRNTSAPLLANLCGFSTPSPIRSTSNEMLVIFASDASSIYSGFRAAFVFLDDPSVSCIQFIVPEGVFRDSNEDCLYYVNTLDVKQQVVVYFWLNLDCDSDTLLVFDGGTSDGELLLLDGAVDVCPLGTTNRLQVHGSKHHMLILFNSTNHSYSTGIDFARYFADSSEHYDCGGVFNESGSTFTSPNYPLNYNNHDNCGYLAIAPAGMIIVVVFSSFSLGYHPECVYDAVRVYDGDSISDPLLATFCGSGIPGSIISSGNSLLVKFTSDYFVTRSGFEGTFNIVSSFFETGCNHFVNISGDVLRSRNFPNSYGDNANCHYLIRAPDGKYVQIVFLSFQLDPNCLEDSLMIFDGNSTEATLLDTLCGFEVPKPVRTSGSEAYLVFSSDDFISYQGFLASVIFLDAGSGLFFDPVTTIVTPDIQQTQFATNITNGFSVESGDLFFANNITSEELVENGAPCISFIGTNGSVISSPNYPLEDYDNDVRCTFYVRAPNAQLVLLVFDSFDVEFEPSCLWDFLQVSDTFGSDLGKFCGSSIPQTIQSSSFGLELYFASDATVTRPGFNATVYFIERDECSHTLNLNGSRITSPSFPHLEPPGLYCEYFATASEGQIVELMFTSFDVASLSLDCLRGSVKVYDGNSTNNTLIATLCGRLLPRNLYSSGKEMFVTYSSKSYIFGGFEAFFHFLSEDIDLSCYEEVRESSIVSSYYYPHHASTCTHQIQAPESLRVVLIFTSVALHTPLTEDCLSNGNNQFGIWVFDGNHETDPVILRHCSPSLPHVVEASRNQMLVRSTTTPYIMPFGFSAVVKFVDPNQCMQTIVLSGSLITSPSFENNALCYYLIVAPDGSTISLSFTFFSLEEHPDCIYDSLAVYDGNSAQSRHMATLCGYSVPDPIVSTQNQMFLEFSTDFAFSSAGFTAEATFTEDMETTESLQTTRSDEFTTSGPEVTTSSDTDLETTERIQTTELSDRETTASDNEFHNKGLQNDGTLSCDNANPCLGSHVTCIDDSTDPYCVCESGYEFVDSSQRECIAFQGFQNDGKLSCDNANPCLGSHVTCMDDSKDPYCVCERGYQFVDSSHRECIDVNECSRGLDDCEPSENVVCINEDGGYSCRCLDGFTITANGSCQRRTSTTTSDVDRDVFTLLAFRITAINQQSAVFSTKLLDETSNEFNLMASFTCSSVMEVFGDIPSIPDDGCSALGFRSGSIKVFLQLEIASGETVLSTKSMKETFMTKVYDDSHGFKVLRRANGDSITIDGSSVLFEYINDISCDNFVCQNGGTCKVNPKIYERICLCSPKFTGSRCETEKTRVMTTQRIDKVSVMTQNRGTLVLFILIPFAFAASLILFLTCCCYVSLKHKTNKKTAVVDQVTAVDKTDLHALNRDISQRMPMVIRNPGVTNYEESELEDEKRLKHFERIFSEMRRSGRHSIPSSTQEDQTESRKCLSEFSHPYTADGSVNL